VFNKMPSSSVVAWTTMISGHVKHGWGQKATSTQRCMARLCYFCGAAEYMCQHSCAWRGPGMLEHNNHLDKCSEHPILKWVACKLLKSLDVSTIWHRNNLQINFSNWQQQ
jgi:hypothetical protein